MWEYVPRNLLKIIFKIQKEQISEQQETKKRIKMKKMVNFITKKLKIF